MSEGYLQLYWLKNKYNCRGHVMMTIQTTFSNVMLHLWWTFKTNLSPNIQYLCWQRCIKLNTKCKNLNAGHNMIWANNSCHAFASFLAGFWFHSLWWWLFIVFRGCTSLLTLVNILSICVTWPLVSLPLCQMPSAHLCWQMLRFLSDGLFYS